MNNLSNNNLWILAQQVVSGIIKSDGACSKAELISLNTNHKVIHKFDNCWLNKYTFELVKVEL